MISIIDKLQPYLHIRDPTSFHPDSIFLCWILLHLPSEDEEKA